MEQTYKRRLPIPNMTDGEDRLLGMVLALTSELAVTRERMDTLERLLADAGMLPAGAVEQYDPGEAAQCERDQLRKRIIAKVMKPIRDGAARDAAAVVEGKGER